MTLVKTLYLGNVTIYASVAHNRYKIARGTANADLYENEIAIPILGKLNRGGKSMHMAIVFGEDLILTDAAREDILKNTFRFDLTGETLRQDGITERVEFYNMELDDTKDKLTFIVDGKQNQKLLSFLAAI